MASTEAKLRSDSQPQEEIEVDWSDLPADLLQSISKKLPDIADFIYFRTVCKRWRTATSISDMPPQIPWLLEARNYKTNIDSEYLRFYCLFSGKVHTVRCPQSRGKWFRGPSHGYLYALSVDNLKHSLINPLNKDEVAIPFSEYYIRRFACMDPDPFGNNHMAFLLVKIPITIGFYQPRQGEWKYAELSRYDLALGQACFKGMFYRNETETGATVVVDIASGSSFLIPPPPETYDRDCAVHFVESAGKILRIIQKSDHSLDVSDFFFDIYQLDVEGQNDKFRWVKTSSIGDQVLFLDRGSGISVTASRSTGLVGNCIYFLSYRHDSGEWNCKPYRYNMEDRKTERIPCPFNSVSTWFVPSVLGFLPNGPY